MQDKPKLLRVVVLDNALLVDFEQKKMARGAYICKNAQCIQKAQKGKVFSRMLKGSVSPEIYEELLEYAK